MKLYIWMKVERPKQKEEKRKAKKEYNQKLPVNPFTRGFTELETRQRAKQIVRDLWHGVDPDKLEDLLKDPNTYIFISDDGRLRVTNHSKTIFEANVGCTPYYRGDPVVRKGGSIWQELKKG